MKCLSCRREKNCVYLFPLFNKSVVVYVLVLGPSIFSAWYVESGKEFRMRNLRKTKREKWDKEMRDE